MHRTYIKFCGITRPQDASLAEQLGADFLGMNFFAGPRKITRDTAREIIAAVSDKIEPVALTASNLPAYPDAPSIDQIIGDDSPLRFDYFQVYGPPAYGKNQVYLWQVHSVGDRQSLADLIKRFQTQPPAEVVLLDAAVKGQLGGTGVTFDWKMLAEMLAAKDIYFPPIILAGGLNPDNVGQAIRIVRPWAVDVSSGIESSTPGVKDPAKMKAFIQAVRAADNER
jgi:phosphoribosylanthranilate isomerase